MKIPQRLSWGGITSITERTTQARGGRGSRVVHVRTRAGTTQTARTTLRRIFEDRSASEEGVCRAHSADEGTDIRPNGTSGNGRNGLFVSNQVLFSSPGDQIIIILHRPQYDIMGDVGTVDADELHSLGVLAGDVLVGREVVDQTADDVLRKLINISQMAIDGIIFQDSDDLVVSLVVVEKTKPADRPGPDDDISVRNILFSKDTDIERITVTSISYRASA